jgi:hypothetical protein
MPRAVAVVQSQLATQWIILVSLLILVRLFYGSEVAEDATRCSVSVRTVTVGNVIAAHIAACRRAGNNGGAPIVVISKAPKDEQIIATVSASTGTVAGESVPA